MKIKLLTCFILVSVAFSAFAQQRSQNWCGTSQYGEEMNRGLDGFVDAYYDNEESYRGGISQKWIPLTIHLLSNSDGTKQVPVEDALDLICEVNALYEGTDAMMHFYLSEFNYIANTNLNTLTEANFNTVIDQLSANKEPNTVNTFLTGNTADSVVCGVYFPFYDFHLVSSGCASASTWGHEMGHHFTLNHPFYGWETEAYNCGTQAPNTVDYFNQTFQVEKLNMSNCTVAGDRICDTRPDYLSGRWTCNGNSESDCAHIDPNGQSFNVDGTNIVSYSNDGCGTVFTTDQRAAMHYNIDVERPNLPTASVNTNAVENINLIYPEIEAYVGNSGSVTLEWESTGATHYLLQVSTIQNFNVVPLMVFNEIVTADSYTLSGLASNDDYFWRVKPFTPGYTCASFSPSNYKFTTSNDPNASVQTISAVQNLNAYPNPLNSGETLNIELNSDRNFDAQISMYNVNGQLAINTQTFEFETGDNQLSLDVKNLSTGVYVLFIQSDEGVISQKILVQ